MALLGLALLSGAPSTRAQDLGRLVVLVADGLENPVPGVRVRIGGNDGELAEGWSDSHGVVTLGGTSCENVSRLEVSIPGWVTLTGVLAPCMQETDRLEICLRDRIARPVKLICRAPVVSLDRTRSTRLSGSFLAGLPGAGGGDDIPRIRRRESAVVQTCRWAGGGAPLAGRGWAWRWLPSAR